MPGTQPRGTHASDPASSSSQSATQVLDVINLEEDGVEGQVGPPLDSPMANVLGPEALASPPISPDVGIIPESFRGTFSVNPGASSSFGSTKPPPPSSTIPLTVYPHPTQRHDVSMGSAHSITTSSDGRSSQLRKRKQDASSMQPPSKRKLKSKTIDLNPVIISNALNSTLNRMVDVMERTLDANPIATTTSAAPTSVAPPSIITFPIKFQLPISSTPSNPSSASASITEILDQAIRIVSADDSGLLEDQLLAASLFFTSASEDAVCAAQTFIALGNNQVVQQRFLLRQLDTAALLSRRGKAKAMEDSDHLMEFSFVFEIVSYCCSWSFVCTV